MKKITCFFLVLLALVFIFPVLFLVVGSLMGKNELTDLLFPVLQEGAKGYASWKLFPEYPTLKHYVEVLLDSPEFFVMFWNSVKDYGWCPRWRASGWNACCMGICQI